MIKVQRLCTKFSREGIYVSQVSFLVNLRIRLCSAAKPVFSAGASRDRRFFNHLPSSSSPSFPSFHRARYLTATTKSSNLEPQKRPIKSMATNHPSKQTQIEETQSHRLYSPYQDLQIPYQTIYQLPTRPEYLFPEESARQRRSWGENLTYYTGCGYLAGAVSGAGKGLVEGVRAFEPGDTTKLRINRVLNASGHAGRVLGNRAGVIGLMFAGLESGIVAVRDTDDVINSVVAGLGTGALYKAASGPRSAAVAGAIGGLAAGLAVAAKHAAKRYVPF
ncbi:hypothetical protein Dimus_004134 [Dionaea muscipula]